MLQRELATTADSEQKLTLHRGQHVFLSLREPGSGARVWIGRITAVEPGAHGSILRIGTEKDDAHQFDDVVLLLTDESEPP